MEISQGDTFLIPSGPRDLLHLFIVCSGLTKPPDYRLIVSISTIRDGKFFDPTCIIEADEHEFITTRSFVSYRHADQKSANHIEKCIQNGTFSPRGVLSEEVFERVIKGFYDSEFTDPWVYDFL